MKNQINILIIGVISLILLMNSCKGDDIIISTSIENSKIYSVPGPLVKKYTISIQDIIEEIDSDEWYADEDGLINFISKSNINVVWDDLAIIKDIDISKRYKMGDHIQNGNQFTLVEKLSIDMNKDTRYDYAEISKGILWVIIEVPENFVGDIIVRSPMFQPELSTVFYADGVNATNYVISFNTKDHKLVFDQNDAQTFIPVELESNFDAIGDLNEKIAVKYTYKNVETKNIYGYFGKKTIELPNEKHSLGDVKDAFGDAKYNLKEITYALNLENYLGVPFNLTATNLRFYENDNDENYKLLLVDNESKVTTFVDAATINNSIITPTYGRKEVTTINSNILEVSNPMPSKVLADIDVLANPNGEIAGKQNFIHGRDTLFGIFEIRAPLWLKIESYSRKDTIEFDFRDIFEDDEDWVKSVELLELFIGIENSLPFNVDANFYAIDNNDVIVDYILSDFKNILMSGQVLNEKVINSTYSELVVELNNSQINKFFDEKVMNLVLETKASSYNKGAEYVKVYEDYNFEFKIKMELKFKIPKEELGL